LKIGVPKQLSGIPLVKIGQSLLIIGIALGVAFLVYSSPFYSYAFGLNASGAGTSIKFIHWSDGTVYNTISLSYNIYADVTTYDANATYGITNTATKPLIIGLRMGSISNNGKVANVTLTILSQDGTQLMARVTWSAGNTLPTSQQSFTASAKTNYVIQVSIKGASAVGVGDIAGINLQMTSSG
jgi:hypothetical protein